MYRDEYLKGGGAKIRQESSPDIFRTREKGILHFFQDSACREVVDTQKKRLPGTPAQVCWSSYNLYCRGVNSRQ
jgi:hypothetical protein